VLRRFARWALSRFNKVGCLSCQNVEQLKVLFGRLMGRTPMGGDHSDDIPATADQRRGLAREYASLKIDLLILGTGHEVAGSYICRDHPLLVAQRDSAGTLRVCAYPLPKLSGLGIESSERQQPQFPASSPLWKQHLHTGEIGVHQDHCIIDNLLVIARSVG
jgi:hypothetical protein